MRENKANKQNKIIRNFLIPTTIIAEIVNPKIAFLEFVKSKK